MNQRPEQSTGHYYYVVESPDVSSVWILVTSISNASYCTAWTRYNGKAWA